MKCLISLVVTTVGFLLVPLTCAGISTHGDTASHPNCIRWAENGLSIGLEKSKMRPSVKKVQNISLSKFFTHAKHTGWNYLAQEWSHDRVYTERLIANDWIQVCHLPEMRERERERVCVPSPAFFHTHTHTHTHTHIAWKETQTRGVKEKQNRQKNNTEATNTKQTQTQPQQCATHGYIWKLLEITGS